MASTTTKFESQIKELTDKLSQVSNENTSLGKVLQGEQSKSSTFQEQIGKIYDTVGTSNQFSADQGYSEHQLGTTLDFTTPIVGALLTGFETTPAYKWLVDNAHKFGFTLSYSENNKYYEYEPWHWRFVGVDLANKLHRENKYFYDLEQREIYNYLLVLFN